MALRLMICLLAWCWCGLLIAQDRSAAPTDADDTLSLQAPAQTGLPPSVLGAPANHSNQPENLPLPAPPVAPVNASSPLPLDPEMNWEMIEAETVLRKAEEQFHQNYQEAMGLRMQAIDDQDERLFRKAEKLEREAMVSYERAVRTFEKESERVRGARSQSDRRSRDDDDKDEKDEKKKKEPERRWRLFRRWRD